MAMLWVDDFRRYQPGTLPRGAWSGGSLPTLANVGRAGKQAIVWNKNAMIRGGGGSTVYVVAPYQVESGGRVFTSTVSEAGYPASTLTSAHWLVGCSWLGFAYCGLVATDDGAVHAVSGGAFENGPNSQDVSILGSSAAGVLPIGRGWFVLEFVATIAITGSIIVRINGQTVLQLTGVYTKCPGDYCVYVLKEPPCPLDSPFLWPNYADAVVIGGATRGGRYTNGLQGWRGAIDLVSQFNQAGTIDGSTFLGDLQVNDLLPTSDGGVSESTITGTAPAATRWQSVDDLLTPDGDTTSVTFARATAPDTDEYGLSDLGIDPAATIVGVQATAIARTSVPGFAGLRLALRDGGNTALAPAIIARTSTFKPLVAPLPERPGGGDWTVADLDAVALRVTREV